MAQAAQFKRMPRNQFHIQQRLLQTIDPRAARKWLDDGSGPGGFVMPGYLFLQRGALVMTLIKVAARLRQPAPVYTGKTMSAYEA